MKKILRYLLYCALISQVFANTDAEKITQHDSLSLNNYDYEDMLESENPEFGPTQYKFIPYIESTFLSAGIGFALRGQQKHLGFQVDIGTGLIVLVPIKKASASLLFYPLAEKNGVWHSGGWNIGIGLGGAIFSKGFYLFQQKMIIWKENRICYPLLS